MKARRGRPKIWHADWLVLAPLAQVIGDQIKAFVAPSATIVDFGCGDMPYKKKIEDCGIKYIGADIDVGADMLIDVNGHLALIDGTVDAILSAQVLEHVRDLDRYCLEIHRLLKDFGTLFLSTHGTWLYHPHPEDHRRWTGPGLIAEVEAQGFKVDEIIPIIGPLATTTLIRLTGYAFVLRKVPFLGTILSYAMSILMNVRATLEEAITPVEMTRNNACVYFIRARKA